MGDAVITDDMLWDFLAEAPAAQEVWNQEEEFQFDEGETPSSLGVPTIHGSPSHTAVSPEQYASHSLQDISVSPSSVQQNPQFKQEEYEKVKVFSDDVVSTAFKSKGKGKGKKAFDLENDAEFEGATDAELRRLQNRIAQQRHRQRKLQAVQDLEAKLEEKERVNEELRRQIAELKLEAETRAQSSAKAASSRKRVATRENDDEDVGSVHNGVTFSPGNFQVFVEAKEEIRANINRSDADDPNGPVAIAVKKFLNEMKNLCRFQGQTTTKHMAKDDPGKDEKVEFECCGSVENPQEFQTKWKNLILNDLRLTKTQLDAILRARSTLLLTIHQIYESRREITDQVVGSLRFRAADVQESYTSEDASTLRSAAHASKSIFPRLESLRNNLHEERQARISFHESLLATLTPKQIGLILLGPGGGLPNTLIIANVLESNKDLFANL